MARVEPSITTSSPSSVEPMNIQDRLRILFEGAIANSIRKSRLANRLLSEDCKPGDTVAGYNHFMLRKVSKPIVINTSGKSGSPNVTRNDSNLKFDEQRYGVVAVIDHVKTSIMYCTKYLPGHVPLSIGHMEVYNTSETISKIVEKIGHVASSSGSDDVSKEGLPSLYRTTLSLKELVGVEDKLVEICLNNRTKHPDWEILSTRLRILFLHLSTNGDMVTVTNLLYKSWNRSTNKPAPLVSNTYLKYVNKCCSGRIGVYGDIFDTMLDFTKDYDLDHAGVVKFTNDYLHSVGYPKVLVERPQHAFMRIAISVCGYTEDIEAVRTLYQLLSNRYFTYATPFYGNAGAKKSHASCFLFAVDKDELGHMMHDILGKVAMCTADGGGIGLDISTIRSSLSEISSTSSKPCGIIQFMHCLVAIINAANQGKRRGALAIYLYFCHLQIEEFLEVVDQTARGDTIRDIHIGLKVSNLFVDAAKTDDYVYLFCPGRVPDLFKASGNEFTDLYKKYVAAGLYNKKIKALELMSKIKDCYNGKGEPFFVQLDNMERSNHYHLRKIMRGRMCVNLCTEVIQFVPEGEIGVCNLASVVIPRYILATHPSYESIKRTTDIKVRPGYIRSVHGVVDRITFNGVDIRIPKIDNWVHENGDSATSVYDLRSMWISVAYICLSFKSILKDTFLREDAAKVNNENMRSIAIGAQGLSDALQLMMIPYESKCAREFIRTIGEVIQHACFTVSIALGRKYGCWKYHEGSNLQRGLLSMDFHTKRVEYGDDEVGCCDKMVKENVTYRPIRKVKHRGNLLVMDWDGIRKDIHKYCYYSQMTSYMPNVSTSAAMGCSPSIDPRPYNLYNIRGQNGDIRVLNPILVKLLMATDRWSNKMRREMVRRHGSVKDLPGLSDLEKQVFKTSVEVKQTTRLKMASELIPFVDQGILQLYLVVIFHHYFIC